MKQTIGPHTIEKTPQIQGAVSLTRRHVLGELYSKCDPITGEIPVYLDGEALEVLGHVDEGLGAFRDAFSFHLGVTVSKDLCAGYYTFSFDCERAGQSRFKLVSITLKKRENYGKPVARRKRADDVEA